MLFVPLLQIYSIGAFYAMCALAGRSNAAAYFISPIVDLERIEGVTLDEEHLRHAYGDARRALGPHSGADGVPVKINYCIIYNSYRKGVEFHKVYSPTDYDYTTCTINANSFGYS